MNKIKASFFTVLLLVVSQVLMADDGVSFKAVPTLSSNPSSGTGVGLTGIMIYTVDEESSPSQTIVAAQYTDTDSYNVFLVNRMFFSSDVWQSISVIGLIHNNSEFDVDIDIPSYPSSVFVNFNMNIAVIFQQFLYEIKDNFYFGPQVFYIDQVFDPLNPAGEAFLITSGIEDSHRLGLGVTFSYDTRSKEEKFYPRESQLVNLSFNNFSEALGVENHFYQFSLNARDYRTGLKSDDVLATQLYAQYCSDDTPDGSLSSLGAKSILRGFPMGQYKARNLVALQSEYRYQLSGTRFRFVGFGGYANLSGGSKGTDAGNREKDNGNYYSAGFGARYTLDEKQGLDYRVDFARTSKHENSIYGSLNQAF